MKSASAILLSIAIVITSVLMANAQGRGHGRGHSNVDEKHHDHRKEWKGEHRGHGRSNDREYGRGHHEQSNRYDYDRHSHSDRRDHHHHGRSRADVISTYPVYTHHHHSHDCGHSVVVVRHYERPRYVYYRDYNVYYDRHRHVYITLSGRRWIASTALPVALHHVDLRRAACHDVNYYDDDFVAYLDLGRPMYR